MILSDPLFQVLFNSPVPRIIVKANAPLFTIVVNNDAHKALSNLLDTTVEGRSLLEVFNTESWTGSDGESLNNALAEALRTNKTVLMPPFRYDLPAVEPGDIPVKWWQLEITPVGGGEDSPEYLLATTHDVTEQVSKQQTLGNGRDRENLLNEDLAKANIELNAIVEELRASHEELQELNQTLEERIRTRTSELSASESKFRNLVEQAPVAIALLTGKDHVVSAANAEMLRIWGKSSDSVMSKTIITALPEMEGQAYLMILEEVYKTGIPYVGSEAEVILYKDNLHQTGYFNFINYPLRDAGGNIEGVMVVATEVTDQVLARNRTQESERDLYNLIMHAHYPLTILKGPDWIIEVANQQIADLWGVSLSEINGKRLLDVLPELADQPFPALLKKVYESGVGYGQDQGVFYLNTSEGIKEKFISFYYDPLFGNNGEVKGIIVSANDISDVVKSRQMLEESYIQQKGLNENLECANEELAAANEELAAANEELASFNEDLTHSQYALEEINRSLAASELRFRYLVQQAPVAICILRSRDHIIETANDRILNVWGKTADVIGKPFSVALPELEGQPFFELLDHIYTSGEVYYGNEVKALLEHKGELMEGYYNFICQPVKDESGNTAAIMIVATDVTEQVNAKKELERAYEQASLSKKAAQLGTFDMDLLKGTMEWDARCRELFGISHQDAVTYENDFIPGLHEADRDRIIKLIETLFDRTVSNGNYDVEYRTIGLQDGKLRWVRAKGKVFFNEGDEPVRFIGSVLDITDQKHDEQRKNDFIGMVSHELKTPLTSLKAYIQLLHRTAKEKEDVYALRALAQAEKQVKKMTNMIGGFLNLSRLESGKLYLDLAEVNLNELIQEVISDIKLTVPGHTFAFMPTGAIYTQVDIEKIVHVLSNLLSNAVKYSNDGGFIEVKTELSKNFVIVTIKDDGIGIESNHLDKLFDRYYRVERNNTKYISGFGIGLYLSAEIIHLHKGRIWVESEAGSGSTFYFSLPMT